MNKLMLLLIVATTRLCAEVNKEEEIARGVYFHEGDLKGKGHCNNGWIIFEDYVLVVDANFPSGALEIIPKIKAATDRPIRFAFDTHHHGDHAYGNQIWADNGAVPVAHAGVLSEIKKHEPGRWNDTAKGRKDVSATKLKMPTLLYNKDMIFDDGKHRVELLHLGVAHTRGDGFAWLPKERILFTGDACLNGPYNFMGDGDSKAWVATLEAAKKYKPRIVCPGHGPMAGPELLDQQQTYFVELRRLVKKVAKKKPAEAKAAAADIKATILKNDQIAKYVGGGFEAQVDKVYVEFGGKSFLTPDAAEAAHQHHAHAHGH